MLKKIAITIAASAVALTLAVPVASACGGHKSKTATEKSEAKEGVIAKEDKAKDETKTKAKAKKAPTKVSSKS